MHPGGSQKRHVSVTITLFASFEALPSPGFCLQVNITNG